jgi:predicted amidohydrolase
MAPLIKKYKAAAVNAEPGWLDLELSVQKTIHWINEAGKNGCKLIAFPELCMYHTPLSNIITLHRWICSLQHI